MDSIPIQNPAHRQRSAGIDLLRILASFYIVLLHVLGQLFQGTVGISSQGFAVFLKPAHPVQAADTAHNQPNPAAQTGSAEAGRRRRRRRTGGLSRKMLDLTACRKGRK